MKLLKIDIGYLLLLVVCIAELIRSSVVKDTFDIHFHDTMFVISKSFCWRILTLYFLFLLIANHYLANTGASRIPWFILSSTVCTGIALFVFIRTGESPDHLNYHHRFRLTAYFISLLLIIILAVHLIFWFYFYITVVRKTLFNKDRFNDTGQEEE